CSSLSTHHSWSWTLLKAPETSWHFLQWLFQQLSFKSCLIPCVVFPQSNANTSAGKRHGDQERPWTLLLFS
ncbi:unnamed protein product, partial [Brassica rapa subsp. trilocularis]